MKKIGICQPYFLPHIGYFQLINAVDVFISYDDVNFIKNGWINRNRFLVNGTEKIFTIPLQKQSPFKKINETVIDWQNKSFKKFFKTIEQNYSKSTYKYEMLDVIESIFSYKPKHISELSLRSLQEFCKYLEINTIFKNSSECKYIKCSDRTMNLINICKSEKAEHYINSLGGMKLYNKNDFAKQGIVLNFISGTVGMSILDICMNYSKEEIKEQLEEYVLL